MNDKPGIAIIATGYLSPDGTGLSPFFNLIQQHHYTCSTIDNYDPEGYLGDKGKKFLNRPTILYGNLAYQCYTSLVTGELCASEMIGLYNGSELSNLEDVWYVDSTTLSEGPNTISPLRIPNLMDSMSGNVMAMKANLKGPNVTVNGGDCSDLNALDIACLHLEQGLTHLAIVCSTSITSSCHELVRKAAIQAAGNAEIVEFGAAIALTPTYRADSGKSSVYGTIKAISTSRVMNGEEAERALLRAMEDVAGPVGQPAKKVDLVVIGRGNRLLDIPRFESMIGKALQAPVCFPEWIYGETGDSGGLAGILFGIGLFQGMIAEIPAKRSEGKIVFLPVGDQSITRIIVGAIDANGNIGTLCLDKN